MHAVIITLCMHAVIGCKPPHLRSDGAPSPDQRPPTPQADGPGGIPVTGQLVPQPAGLWTHPGSAVLGVGVGQIAGIARGGNGTLWLFHRGDRVWDGESFNGDDITYKEPIRGHTILKVDEDTGKVSGRD